MALTSVQVRLADARAVDGRRIRRHRERGPGEAAGKDDEEDGARLRAAHLTRCARGAHIGQREQLLDGGPRGGGHDPVAMGAAAGPVPRYVAPGMRRRSRTWALAGSATGDPRRRTAPAHGAHRAHDRLVDATGEHGGPQPGQGQQAFGRQGGAGSGPPTRRRCRPRRPGRSAEERRNSPQTARPRRPRSPWGGGRRRGRRGTVDGVGRGSPRASAPASATSCA